MHEMIAEPDVKKLVLLIPQKERHLGAEVAVFQYLKASNKENGVKPWRWTSRKIPSQYKKKQNASL